MVIGFISHKGGGNRSGARAIAYLLREDDFEKKGRNPLPEVLKGDPEQTAALIDSLEDYKRPYESGYLSFAESSDKVPPSLQQTIIERFEKVAFAGLEPDQYDCLWIRHEDKGRVELHLITPRIELSTGKSLNVDPPGKSSRNLFNTFRLLVNTEYDLADPEEPGRRRLLDLPKYIKKQRSAGRDVTDGREVIHEFIANRVEDGKILCKDDIAKALQKEGFKTVSGKDYLTVINPETAKRFRMKGRLYEDSFRSVQAIRGEDARGKEDIRESAERIAELSAKVDRLVAKRAEYNRSKYPGGYRTIETGIIGEVQSNGTDDQGFNGAIDSNGTDDHVQNERDRIATGNELERKNSSNHTKIRKEGDFRPMAECSDSGSANRTCDIFHSDISHKVRKGGEHDRNGAHAFEDLEAFRRRLSRKRKFLDRFIEQFKEGVFGQRKQIDDAIDRLERSSYEIRGEVERLEQGIVNLKKHQTSELQIFRTEINLSEFAAYHGYQIKIHESYQNIAVMESKKGDRINVTKNENGYWNWHTYETGKSGSIIDFHKNITDESLGEALKNLKIWNENKPHVPEGKYIKNLTASSKENIWIQNYFFKCKECESHPDFESIGIKTSTLQDDNFKGKIFKDVKNFIIFPQIDLQGFSGFEACKDDLRQRSKGGREGVWFSNLSAKDKRLVICESPKDALSYHQLKGDSNTRYLAFYGKLNDKSLDLIKKFMSKIEDAEIVIAVNNTKESKEYIKDLQEIARESGKKNISVDIPSKEGHSWKDEIKKQDFEKELQINKSIDNGYGM